MPTIASYLNELDKQRKKLAENLTQKGITSSQDEKFNSLVPKVLQIEQSGGGIDTTDATATADKILLGSTAYVNGEKITGIIPLKSSQVYTPTTENQEILFGSYLSGNQIILGDSNLLPQNIKSGVSLFGVAGTLDTDIKPTVEVPLYINGESANVLYGPNFFFKDDVRNVIDSFSTFSSRSDDFFNSDYDYSMYYTSSLGWDATVQTVCTIPVFFDSKSLIKYTLKSSDLLDTEMRLVKASGTGEQLVENIFSNSNVEGLYVDLGITYFYQTTPHKFIKDMPKNLNPGIYYLYFKSKCNNTKAMFYDISVVTTDNN